MKININTRDTNWDDWDVERVSEVDLVQRGAQVLGEALFEFYTAREPVREYMDRRYPIEHGGVHTDPEDRKLKRLQIIRRCDVAKALRQVIWSVTVEHDGVIMMPLKTNKRGAELKVGLGKGWVATCSNDRIESINKYPVLRFLRENEVDLEHPMTRKVVYAVAMDMPPAMAVSKDGWDREVPADFNLEQYR